MFVVGTAGVFCFLFEGGTDEILKFFKLFETVIENPAFAEDTWGRANFESGRKPARMFY